MASKIKTNLRFRRRYSKTQEVVDIPNLIAIQKKSYDRFLQADVEPEKREEVVAKIMANEPWTLVPQFNDPYVIAGQGTIGLEIAQDLPEVDRVVKTNQCGS